MIGIVVEVLGLLLLIGWGWSVWGLPGLLLAAGLVCLIVGLALSSDGQPAEPDSEPKEMTL